MKEIYKIIPMFEPYSVSNLGNIRNNITGKQKVKSITRDYYYVDLHNKGVRKNSRVCRLVANLFLDNPDKKEQVNHKDSNKLNDSVDNLEWVTPSENIRHRIKFFKDNGIYKSPKGNIKYSREIIDKILELSKIYNTRKEISDILSIPISTVAHILLGTRRKTQ